MEDAEAMIATAMPRGLSGQAPLGGAVARYGGDSDEDGHGDFAQPPDGIVSEDGVGTAPADGGWKSIAAGRGEETGGEERGGGVGGGDDDPGLVKYRRFYGLPFEDEWMSATSNRIEKLNSRASWKRSWTDEVIKRAVHPLGYSGGFRIKVLFRCE